MQINCPICNKEMARFQDRVWICKCVPTNPQWASCPKGKEEELLVLIEESRQKYLNVLK